MRKMNRKTNTNKLHALQVLRSDARVARMRARRRLVGASEEQLDGGALLSCPFFRDELQLNNIERQVTTY